MSGFAAEAAGPAALNEPTPEQRAKVTQLCCCLLLEDMFILVHLKLCAGPEVRRRTLHHPMWVGLTPVVDYYRRRRRTRRRRQRG